MVAYYCFLFTIAELEVSNIRCTGLSIPPDMICNAVGLKSAMFAKVKAVDRNGHSKTKAATNTHTNVVSATTSPEWPVFKFLFTCDDRFDKESYIRVEIVVEKVPANVCVGAIFIPIEFFGAKEQDYTFPVSRFRMPSAIYAYTALRNGDFGSVTVRLRKLQQHSDSRVKLHFRTRVRESNLFNNCWFGECFPAGAIDNESMPVETANVVFLIEGMKLIDTQVKSLEEGKAEDKVSAGSWKNFDENAQHITSTDSLALTERWTTASVSNVMREHVLEVFENQRRSPIPPFDWSSSALTRANFSDLEFKRTFKLDSIFSAQPPEGWEWSGSWMQDKTYLKTDIDGWTYGMKFSFMVESMKMGKSRDKPINAYARRRKWMRRVVATGAGAELSTVLGLFEAANDKKPPSSKTSITRTASTMSPKPSEHEKRLNASASQTSWRKEKVAQNPQAILCVCKEKIDANAPIYVPWDKVSVYSVISPSVLSITFQIERYIASDSSQIQSFRPADVEIYLTNCPAEELSTLMDERIMFLRYRRDIKHLVQCGNLTGGIEKIALLEGNDGIPETEELSLGSETMAEMDNTTIALENTINALDERMAKREDKNVTLERSILLRRVCRLRLYMAAMFGVGFQGIHNFKQDEVRAIMEADFKRAQKITQDSDVATANNRIEYLL
ncbi:hypothetical protein EON65_28135, partial [archaeon]